MTEPTPAPTPEPEQATQMIASLRTRLAEAVASGKASDAKAYLDLIDRLQNQSTDTLSPVEAVARRRAEAAQFVQELRDRIDRFVKPTNRSKPESTD